MLTLRINCEVKMQNLTILGHELLVTGGWRALASFVPEDPEEMKNYVRLRRGV